MTVETRWMFWLIWKETAPSKWDGQPVTTDHAEPIGPYAIEREAKQARAKYLAGTGWMPRGGHDPEVSDLQRIGHGSRVAGEARQGPQERRDGARTGVRP